MRPRVVVCLLWTLRVNVVFYSVIIIYVAYSGKGEWMLVNFAEVLNASSRQLCTITSLLFIEIPMQLIIQYCLLYSLTSMFTC